MDVQMCQLKIKWDKCSLYSLRLTVETSGSGKLFYSLVVEHTNEFTKVLVFIEGMEKLQEIFLFDKFDIVGKETTQVQHIPKLFAQRFGNSLT